MWVWICWLLKNESRAKRREEKNTDRDRERKKKKNQLTDGTKEGMEKGINLGSVLDTAVSDPEGVNGPVQIESLLRLPKGQPLSQSSLINLDNINTSFLKILHFILDSQSYLIASLESGNWYIYIMSENKETVVLFFPLFLSFFVSSLIPPFFFPCISPT